MIRPNVSATKNSQYCAGLGVENVHVKAGTT